MASMGPPPFSGGNKFIGSVIPAANVKLQWGRRLSAAEIAVVAATAADAEWLQWGRRLSAAEIGHREAGRRGGIAASMGPPPFSGGNRPGGRGAGIDQLASMGPPPFSGGNSQLSWCSLDSIPRFNGAAAFQRRK